MHVFANEALHEILQDDMEIVSNIEDNEIIEWRCRFFIGKNPHIHWMAQRLNAMVCGNNVEDVCKGPRGFFEVVFSN